MNTIKITPLKRKILPLWRLQVGGKQLYFDSLEECIGELLMRTVSL